MSGTKKVADMSTDVEDPSHNGTKWTDEPKKPKRPFPSFLKNVWSYFSLYCDYTSIHGCKYLGERKRSILEK